jgi:uncharacterized damage-inducible protein DinB
MRIFIVALMAAGSMAAQTNPVANPIVSTSKAFYGVAKNDVLKSAEKVPENVWSFKPTPEVRSFGQLVAHEADGQYEICGFVAGKPVDKQIEKTKSSKADIIAALKEAFSYCDEQYASLTDANAGQIVDMFGQKAAKIGVLDFNTQHTNLHYGNMVTYMRLKGIVPASSEPQK